MEVEPCDKRSPQAQALEDMTVIDEVVDETEKKDLAGETKADSVSRVTKHIEIPNYFPRD
jgi:hypothetical protein